MKKILIIAFLAIVLLVASAAAQQTVTQTVTQTVDGFSAATTQDATNSATAVGPGVITQTQAITQNAGTITPGTATVTQTARNNQPGTVANEAAGSTVAMGIDQTAITTAGGAINQRARNWDVDLLNPVANQVVNQRVAQTATAGPLTNIVQGGIGGAPNPAENSARIWGANGIINQLVEQTANGGNNVAQRADNGGPTTATSGPSPLFPVVAVFNGGNGAQARGQLNQAVRQNAGQITPALGGVLQIGENMAVPSASGARVAQEVTQAGTTAGVLGGASVTQTGHNFEMSGWVALGQRNNLEIAQALTQTGIANGGVAANVVNQNGANLADSFGTGFTVNQAITATAWGTSVNQGTLVPANPMRNWMSVGLGFVTGTGSATVAQGQTLNALAFGPGNVVQNSQNNAAGLWAPAATGTLAQAIAQANAGFVGSAQAAINN